MYTYSPLRYPGGKNQLSRFIQGVIEDNGLSGGTYAEPYAGGAGIAMFLLVNGFVSNVFINDLDYSIYAFWYSVVNYTEELCALITNTPVNLETWYIQKKIHKNQQYHSILEVGFSTFFLNRTNRSGILKGGVIGGYEQAGDYKMDCRYNKEGLIERIDKIVRFGDRINVSNMDALDFLRTNDERFDDKTLVYLDPPYYGKGKQLYVNYYCHGDHVELVEYIRDEAPTNWIITYDNNESINTLYNGFNMQKLSIRYSAAKKRKGSELLFYSDNLILPTFT